MDEQQVLEREYWRMRALLRAWEQSGHLPVGRWCVDRHGVRELGQEDEAYLVARVSCARCPMSARALTAYYFVGRADGEPPRWEWVPNPPCGCLGRMTLPPPPEVEAIYALELVAGG